MRPIYRVKTRVPGQMHIMSAPPTNTLEDVCQTLAERDVSKLISLLTDEDIIALSLQEEPATAGTQGIEFVRFPIADFGLPDRETFRREVAHQCDALRRGQSIAIHCRAGIGRTGMIASCILIGLGVSAEDAIAQVSHARGAIVPDTQVQRQFIVDFQLDTPE